MDDIKGKAKSGIKKSAEATKAVVNKAASKAGNAAKAAGSSLKTAGNKVKAASK